MGGGHMTQVINNVYIVYYIIEKYDTSLEDVVETHTNRAVFLDEKLAQEYIYNHSNPEVYSLVEVDDGFGDAITTYDNRKVFFQALYEGGLGYDKLPISEDIQ